MLGPVGVFQRGCARDRVASGVLHTGIAVVADIVEKGRDPVPGQSPEGPGSQVRRGHRSKRSGHVLQGERFDYVQRKVATHLPAVHVQAFRDPVVVFLAQPVFRVERGHVLRGRRHKGQLSFIVYLIITLIII